MIVMEKKYTLRFLKLKIEAMGFNLTTDDVWNERKPTKPKR